MYELAKAQGYLSNSDSDAPYVPRPPPRLKTKSRKTKAQKVEDSFVGTAPKSPLRFSADLQGGGDAKVRPNSYLLLILTHTYGYKNCYFNLYNIFFLCRSKVVQVKYRRENVSVWWLTRSSTKIS